jgi:transposase InsO family protein
LNSGTSSKSTGCGTSFYNLLLNTKYEFMLPLQSKGLIWHTDRGSHKDLLRKYNIIQSMSRRGNCWDNSVAENFFKSLNYNTYFYTKRQAKKEIFEYIEFYYNRIRSHSYLWNLSPVKFEEKQEKEKFLKSKMVA